VASKGLVPEYVPEIFDSLKAIAVAMDVAREDHHDTTQESLRKFESLLITYTPFGTYDLVSVVEKMILSALICGKIMGEREIKSLRINSAAKARERKAHVSQQIDKVIKSVILTKYGKIPKVIAANAIAKKIHNDVSRNLIENNIRKRGLVLSAITKRVQKLRALDD